MQVSRLAEFTLRAFELFIDNDMMALDLKCA